MPSDIVKSELLLTLKEESFVSIKVYREESEEEKKFYTIEFCLGKPFFSFYIRDDCLFLLVGCLLSALQNLSDEYDDFIFYECFSWLMPNSENAEDEKENKSDPLKIETYDIGLQNPNEFTFISKKNLIELTTFLFNKANERANKIIEEEKAKSEIPNKGISYKDELYVNRLDGYCENCLNKLDKYTLPVVLIKTDGSSIIHDVEIGYCEDCDTYFITETELYRLKRYGTPLCSIIDDRVKDGGRSYKGNKFDDYNEESTLKQFGYNVSKKGGLTSNQRQRILAFILEKGILKRERLISFLKFNIKNFSSREDMNFYDAIAKRRKDLEFLFDYKLGTYEFIVLESELKHIN